MAIRSCSAIAISNARRAGLDAVARGIDDRAGDNSP
jgi:hypothetical protein